MTWHYEMVLVEWCYVEFGAWYLCASPAWGGTRSGLDFKTFSNPDFHSDGPQQSCRMTTGQRVASPVLARKNIPNLRAHHVWGRSQRRWTLPTTPLLVKGVKTQNKWWNKNADKKLCPWYNGTTKNNKVPAEGPNNLKMRPGVSGRRTKKQTPEVPRRNGTENKSCILYFYIIKNVFRKTKNAINRVRVSADGKTWELGHQIDPDAERNLRRAKLSNN